jgi:propanol-preferring alcohol dehydrogenase
MKAMVLRVPQNAEAGPLVLTEAPEPRPQAGQVRLLVRACGVCHTDLHTVEGELPAPSLPLIPGHQIVGVVDALGPGVHRLAMDDRVGVGWLAWTCGKCQFCQQGLENLCPEARFTGLHVDGGYAESVVVNEGFAYGIPEGFSDIDATPLLCAGIIGYRSARWAVGAIWLWC